MDFSGWVEYIILNFFAAAAIALDACLLVILKFKDFSRTTDTLKWAAAIGLTHVLFPMIGFVGGWLAIEHYPSIESGIYAFGAFLLGILIYVVIREATKSEEEHESTKPKKARSSLVGFWVPVIYVSIDALLSGPGKTVLIERYPRNLAVFSFFFVGSLVALFTLLAGVISRRLHIRWLQNRLLSLADIAKAATIGILGEISLFSFFFVWCIADFLIKLPEGSNFHVSFTLILIAGLATGAVLSLLFLKKIWAIQIKKAQLLISNSSDSI
jgi:putative Mn2+ efflux pump MntP